MTMIAICQYLTLILEIVTALAYSSANKQYAYWFSFSYHIISEKQSCNLPNADCGG